MIKRDQNGDPYLFTPGDMGRYVERKTAYRNTATDEPISGRFLVRGTAKFTGGPDAHGSPILAINHPKIEPDDIPIYLRWPSMLGPDPR